MAKKKGKKKTVDRKPNWVGDIPMPEVVEKGMVYNFYACRECVYTLEEDQVRPRKKKSILLPGSNKKSMQAVCEKHHAPLLIKFKRCTCGREQWGFYLRSNPTCGECGKFPDIFGDVQTDKIRDYFRLAEYYKTTIENLGDPDRWDCINRALCLECTYDGGSRKGIACKGCLSYQPGRI